MCALRRNDASVAGKSGGNALSKKFQKLNAWWEEKSWRT